jgi:hypothetical protein
MKMTATTIKSSGRCRDGFAQEVVGQGDADGPGKPQHIEEEEPAIRHLYGAGHNGGEGANERHEARQHDGLSAVLFVERLGGQ